MKNIFFKVLFVCLIPVNTFCQDISKGYEKFDSSSGFEFIFSWAGIDGQAKGTGSPLNPDYKTIIDEGMDQNVRFTLFFHLQHFIHINFSRRFGMKTGFTVRNVGFIVKNDQYKSKYRTYTIGIPLALKLGDMGRHISFYAGGEAGFAFNFKEKHFKDGEKNAIKTEWFSNKTNWFQPNLFLGLQFAKGTNIKFSYYPMNFFNEDYREDGRKPFDGVNVNLFYTSLSFQLFHSDLKNIDDELK
jgi:hypothetical protein